MRRDLSGVAYGEKRRGWPRAFCRCAGGTGGTTQRQVLSSAIRSFCDTTRKRQWTPLRILAAFGHRILHLTAHMNLFVPSLMTMAAMLLKPRLDGAGHERAGDWQATVLWRIFCLLLVNAVLFSVLGGALLTRYLLPMYPLVLLVAVSTFHRRVPYWQGLAAFSAVAFVVGLFVNPPYRFAPEDNLAYARVIRMHVAGIAQLNKRYRGCDGAVSMAGDG